jgi:pilus assembly protein CpaC
VIIITPYLVKPVDPSKKMQTPLDSTVAPSNADYFLGDREEVKLSRVGLPTAAAPSRGYGHYLELP